MKTFIPYSLLATLATSGLALGAETAYTNPVGYVTQTCLNNSDTVVGLPLRTPAVSAAALTSNPIIGPSVTPTVADGSALLTVTGASFGSYANTHYVKFKSGVDAGQWFVITAGTADTLTINLNGASLSAANTDTFEVIKFWTLAELINPTTATTDPLTTPNAVVASTSTLAGGRRTQILIPNLAGVGTNLAPATSYFVHGGLWKKPGQGDTDFGADQLWPDTYFIIRNPASVTAATKYTVSGEVESHQFDISLGTQAAVAQDNFISLPRAVDSTLSGLGLGGTPAFVSSTSTLAGGRRDQILVYNNAVAAQNKAPSASYFYHAGLWKKPGQGDTDFGSDVIPAGAGIIVRKYQSGTGASVNWNNSPNY